MNLNLLSRTGSEYHFYCKRVERTNLTKTPHGTNKNKWILRMKLTVFLLLIAIFQVSASSFAQKITMKSTKAPLGQIINEIRNQSGYDFLYNNKLLKNSRPVTINVKEASIEEVLALCFKDQPLTYKVENKAVVLKEKEKGLFSNLADYFSVKEIIGRVIDDNGNGLVGATVRVKGTERSVLTDATGHFKLTGLKGDEVLLVSYIGFTVTEFPLAGQKGSPIIIKVHQISGELDEVTIVNTGYQQLSKEKSTGSVVTIGAQELEKRNAINIFDNLEGTVPGLIRYRGNTTIRGQSTIRAGRNVLVVVDGFPIEGSIEDINPYDIENINVLKDAAAAAIYGARATNGVIVVTTKKAKANNRTSIDFSANLNYYNKPDFSYNNYMTPNQQIDFEKDYYKWYFGGGGGKIVNPVGTFENVFIANGYPITPIQYAYYQFTKNPVQFNQSQLDNTINGFRKNDFQKEFKDNILLNQFISQYNLGVRTNSGKSQSSLVLNYTADNSGMVNSYNKQFNLFYKGTYAIGNWLDINYGVNGILEFARNPTGTYATDPFSFSPYQSMFNTDGSRQYYFPGLYNQYWNATKVDTDPNLRPFKFNHLDEIDRDYRKSTTFNTRYLLGLNLKLLRGLTINPTFQYEDNKRDQETYSAPEGYFMRVLLNEYTVPRTLPNGSVIYENLVPVGGRILNTTLRTPSYTARGQANYSRDFGKHGIIAIAGTEFRQTLNYGRNGVQYGFNDQLQSVNNAIDYRLLTTTPIRPYYRNITVAQALANSGLTREVKHRFASVYANGTYTFDRKYNIFGSIRKDYADIFGASEEYRGRPLWSAGAAWVASNENFIKDVAFIDFLKVRLTYGITGNVDLNSSSTLVIQSNTNTDTQLIGGNIPNPPNEQLRWERTASTNLGLDFTLFKNRLRGTFDWYRKAGSDILAQKRLDPSEGWTTLNMNNAEILNKGIEVSLNYEWLKPVGQKGLSWSSNLVFTQNKGKVTKVDGNIGSNLDIANGNGFRAGYAPNSIFSLRFAGLDDVGLPLWFNNAGEKTANNVWSVIDNFIYSGVTTPTRTIGWNNSFSYQGFSLNVFAIYYGGHVLRATPAINPLFLEAPSNYAVPSYVADAWTPQHTNTVVSGAGEHYKFLGIGQTQYPISDFRVRAADFIKIRNIVLGYTLPQGFAKKIKANALTLRFQLNNPPAIWMKQKDVRIDTETGGAPTLTSYVFGLNVNF